MYADFSRDHVNAFLKEITDVPASAAADEDTLDAEMALLMEQVRCRAAFADRRGFTARQARFHTTPRAHPADCAHPADYV